MGHDHRPRGRDHGRGNDRQQHRAEAQTINPQRLGLPVGPQSDVSEITDCLLKARRHANVLAPAMQLQELPVDHQIAFMVVLFPLDGIETYNNREGRLMAKEKQSNGVWFATDGGNLALTRTALDMLAQAGGVSWVHDQCYRTDNGQTPFLWSYRMTLEIKGLDGRTIQVSREHELDLRGHGNDLSPAASKAGRGLRNARLHGAQLCESKAANRAIRATFGLGAFTVDEASRPFVIPVLRWVPDSSDPVIRRMIAAKELGIVRDVYGAAAADSVRVIEHEPAGQGAPEPRRLPAPNDLPDDMDNLQERVRRDRERQPAPSGAPRPPWEREAERSNWPSEADVSHYCRAAGWDQPPGPREVREMQQYLRKQGRDHFDSVISGGA